MNARPFSSDQLTELFNALGVSGDGRDFLSDIARDPDERFASRSLWLGQIRHAVRSHGHHSDALERALHLLPIDRYAAWVPILHACIIMGHLGAEAYPELAFVDASSTIMRTLTPHLLSQGLMATMLTGCSRELAPFIRVIANSTRLLVNRGTVRYLEEEATRGVLTYRDHCSAWIELVIGGFWRGVGDHLGLDLTTRIVILDRHNCDLHLTW